MTQKHLLALAMFCLAISMHGQNFVINGALFYAGPTSTAISNGGVWVNGGSNVTLNGDLTITKNSTLPEPGNLKIYTGANVNHSGNLFIEQDLMCDGNFINTLSTVEMFGNSNQIIESNILPAIDFHNLNLTGSGLNKQKELINVDARIDGTGVLSLNDRILNTHGQVIQVLNNSPLAITNSDLGSGFGFIASDIPGYLRWNSQINALYFAPLGSVNPGELYRPIQYTASGNDFFKMRLDQHDATLDGFPLANRNEEICQANSKFYHHFKSEAGTSANFNVAFLSGTDGNWSGVAEYVTQWEPTGSNSSSSNNGFDWLGVNNNAYVLNEEAFILTNPGPVANFTYASQDLFYNQVQFTDNSVGASQWNWNFNDGTSSSDVNPFHSFSEGDFGVVLTVTNNFGCTDTATAYIHAGGSLLVPNIFSPDLDGINDFFEVILPAVEEYHLMIFNRWGHILFESNDPSIQWNGEFEGTPCAEGTYFSILSIKQGNYQEQLEGTIQLVRKQQ